MTEIIERCYLSREDLDVVWEKYFSGLVELSVDGLLVKVSNLLGSDVMKVFVDRAEMNRILYMMGVWVYISRVNDVSYMTVTHCMSCLADAVRSSYDVVIEGDSDAE